MFSTLVIALCFSLAHPSIQADLPSFKDAISKNANLTSFNATLAKYYPSLLTYIGEQTSSNPVTILAPSNAAFAKTVYYPIIGPAFSNNDIPTIKTILDYHVVNGDHPSSSLLPTFQYFKTHLTNTSYTNVTGGQHVGGVMQSGTTMIWTSGQSNRSPVIEMDISFAGGTIHIVDSLLIPPTSFPATAELFSTAAEPSQLTSFLGATYFTANGTTPRLGKLLNETTDLTIFAPNNAAMEMVSSYLISLSSDVTAFDNLLKYHIVAGNGGPWYSTQFTENGTVLETLNGASISISFSSNSYFANGARILSSDLLINGGVMHVLDNVLSPDQAGAKPNPSLATQIPALSTGGAYNISSAPFTTFLPNTINTNKPTAGTATYRGGNTATTTRSSSASTGSSGKSGSSRVQISKDRDWLLVWSMFGGIMVGAAAIFI
jgi:transforming growth factor-beta-induced protein